jgi:Zn-dependent peptidase ImmA (M78 family)
MPAVNPQILIWARETADLSLEEAARAISLNDARGKTGAERLAALEAGEEEPSRPLLKRMAEKYRRPLLVFYLGEPPPKGDRGQDFRRLPDEAPAPYNANLDALIRDLNTRQSLVKSLLEDDEAEPLRFIGSARMRQGTDAVADSIISTLRFSLADFRAQRNVSDAFAYLRDRIENSGIFVLLVGNLGSHHTAIPVGIFRGFAIADPIAPFVVVNDQDARAAWSFTALHEVAHLWLGTTGISGTSDELEIERFCNEVAGTILLPSYELSELPDIHFATFEEALAQVSAFAKERNISRAMVAYKLFLAGSIDRPRWQAFRNQFANDWLEGKEKKQEEQGEGAKAGGPNYYVVRRHRLGPTLISLVSRSISDGALSPTKAARILDVKPRNVEPLLSIRQPGGAF